MATTSSNSCDAGDVWILGAVADEEGPEDVWILGAVADEGGSEWERDRNGVAMADRIDKLPKGDELDFGMIVKKWNLSSVGRERGARSSIFRTAKMRIDRQTGTFTRNGVEYNQYAVQKDSRMFASVLVRIQTEFGVAAIQEAFQDSQWRRETVTMTRPSGITQAEETTGLAFTATLKAAQAVTQKSKGDASGWRTLWNETLYLGKGFHRETGQVAQVGVKFRPLENLGWTCHPRGLYKVMSSSSDYEDLLTLGGSLSVEGWGVSASARMSSVDRMQMKTNTITAAVSMCYLSEPIVAINPADATQEVDLADGAQKVMEEKGPVEFHKKYGSHFISGYTQGGSFLGCYCMEFASVEHALRNKANVETSFHGWGVSAAGSADFEKDVKSIQEVTRTWGEYDCDGWSSKHPPKLICEAKYLAEAHDSFDMSSGRKIEAILCRYSDISGYQAALEKYLTNGDESSQSDLDDLLIKEEHYGRISAALCTQYLRVDYICQYLKYAEDYGLKKVFEEADMTRHLFRKALRYDAADEVRERFKELETFLIKHEGEPAPDSGEGQGDATSDEARWKRGWDMWRKLARADELDDMLSKALPDVIVNPPRHLPRYLGNGWEVDATSDNLRFVYKGETKFSFSQLIKDGDPVTIRTGRDGFGDLRLQLSDLGNNVAAFTNTNRQHYETMFLEKL